MFIIRPLFVSVFCFLFSNICLSNEMDTESESDQEWREIYIDSSSTVSDLYQVLHEWEKIKQAIKRYSMISKGKHIKRCDIDDLTIEHIKSIGRRTEKQIKEYHADIKHIIENKNVILRSVVTTNPCYLPSGRDMYSEMNITWFFYRKDGQYKVLETATVM